MSFDTLVTDVKNREAQAREHFKEEFTRRALDVVARKLGLSYEDLDQLEVVSAKARLSDETGRVVIRRRGGRKAIQVSRGNAVFGPSWTIVTVPGLLWGTLLPVELSAEQIAKRLAA